MSESKTRVNTPKQFAEYMAKQLGKSKTYHEVLMLTVEKGIKENYISPRFGNSWVDIMGLPMEKKELAEFARDQGRRVVLLERIVGQLIKGEL